jgi:exodeoxyribonuclease VII small subunit
MKAEQTYTESILELEEIVANLEQGNINVDELSEKVNRASELIRFCKQKLQKTESDVEQILKELNED